MVREWLSLHGAAVDSEALNLCARHLWIAVCTWQKLRRTKIILQMEYRQNSE